MEYDKFEERLEIKKSNYRYGYKLHLWHLTDEWLYVRPTVNSPEYPLFHRTSVDCLVNKALFPEGIGRSIATESNRLFLSDCADHDGKISQSIRKWMIEHAQMLPINKVFQESESARRILIVCEGTKTEPNYFRALQLHTNTALTIIGEGQNTMQVVSRAIVLKEMSEKPYDSVWAVFDKDDFSDDRFNGAIIKAHDHGIRCAWSNEAFELWYLYHFQNRVTAMSRTEYEDKISECVNKSPHYREMEPYHYTKNDEYTFDILARCGSSSNAEKWAEAQYRTFTNEQYAKHNPCTTVFQLVREILDDKL